MRPLLRLSFRRSVASPFKPPVSPTMELNATELQLSRAIQHADRMRHEMSPSDPAQWQRYVEALRGVSLANWSATTDVQMKFALLRTVLNEVR
jgi:hypothetical protein